MEVAKNSKLGTPVKDPASNSQSKTQKFSKSSENSNPNISHSSSPLTKSAKSQKHASKNPVVYSPRNKLRERKFVVAKKNSKKERSDSNPAVSVDCKCKEKFGGNIKKCLCVAYENLRASQEEFFKNKAGNEAEEEFEKEKGVLIEDLHEGYGSDNQGFDEIENSSQMVTWALPGLQPPKVPEADAENQDEINDSSSSFCPSDFVLTAENLGLDRRFSVSSSWDSSQGSISSRTSNGGRRSRRNSSDSVGTIGGRRWKKQLKPTSQKPFKLRTEQRGKVKEEEFMKKIQEMMAEEEKLRIPIAQGLPWTTDEPEVLIKPPVKEHTIPVDLRLHSDVRAVERAEFDHQVAEKMSLIEQYKMERERQQKMAEEEEIKRLRKELVPKAQPMPYFDRPFIPRRSSKHPTIPREPKFHIPHHKKIKCCMSWNDLSSTYSFQGSETREI
ncbi:TPX2 family protein [Corchorus olitorius]|uniref:TPX2 family protein n=1 Tax=Corchorus olitorius TaxID=93759 RepID=A0A1R3ITJ8_9ROSI|nr:TPX2 family protein [Corchorus olitorius]